MNYGLYTSASGMLNSMYRMDVQANNLANMETVGFKPDVPATVQRDAARIEDHLFSLPSNEMLERLGAGVLAAPNQTQISQGALQPTGNPLDVAIKGDGYFVVRQGEGSDTESLRLTRDGRFTMSSEGELIQAATGLRVLDEDDQPITMPPGGRADIDSDGTIRVNGDPVARLQVATVADPSHLRKLGNSLFTADPQVMAKRAASKAELFQNHIERSTVDAVRTMLEITKAERGVGSAAKMIQIHDELMNRAINTFAKMA